MTPRYYHTPPPPASNRVSCPVCHKEVYSRAGIHPQCAVRQSDPPRPKPMKIGVPGELGPDSKAVEAARVEAVVVPTTSDLSPVLDGPRLSD